MSHPRIVMNQNRTILIDYPRLFRGGEDEAYREFLILGFEVEEVVSVEVDRSIGSATLHLNPRCKAISEVLMRLAVGFESFRTPALTPLHRPYFILQEEGSRIIYARAPEIVSGFRRRVYRGLGVLFFGLSVFGVWAPLVPTTPFVILSSYFALRSSPRLNDRLLRSRLFGRILNDWHVHRAMRRSTKKRVLLFMVVVFSLTFGLMQPPAVSLPVALLITLFSFGFVLSIPTVEDGPALPEITFQAAKPALANL